MANITIKTKKEVEELKTVELPAFFKQGDRYLAVFDVDYAVLVWNGKNMTSIDSSIDLDFFDDEMKTYDRSYEEEFRVEYAKAMKRLSIPRREITTANIYNHES